MALAVALASLAAYVAVENRLRGDIDSSLRAQAREIDGRLGGGFGGRFGGPGRRGEAPVYAQLVASDGTTSRPPMGGIALEVDEHAREVAAGTRRAFLSDQEVGDVHLRVLTTQVAPGVAAQLARGLDETDSLLDRLRLALLLVTAGGVVTGAALGWFISGRALRPVRAFTERTERIAGDADVAARLPEDGTDDELGRLTRSFNTTLDALERSVDAQRQLVADASHELRTPLASLRTNIEVLQRADGLPDADRADLLRDLVTQTDELTNLVADVVDLSRRGESQADFEDVRLDEVAGAGLERARRLAPQLVFAERIAPWLVRGNPERLTRLVANLLDNAIKWSPPGGTVEVTLDAGELTVRDHGPGFAEEDIPLVFDRFYRADAARALPGSGLGLAIVRQVAEAHGGHATAENAPDGGALLRVTLPPAP
ncbi:MAG TPA: HAMP domain-containing sensor histidine kinase [Miltoncostaeaceae bacterium]|nr:HAMP domain-containing sensor histidine kinase [Miltoncostaeaceae bacterium]